MNLDPSRVPGVLAGHATDREAHTGCSVLVFPGGAAIGVHLPGSATGTRELGVLRPGHLARRCHALVLSGGSAFGLATADGVMRALAERGIGHRVGSHVVPIVPAAILFDLSVATRCPDADDGRSAVEAAFAGRPFDEGSVGAGSGALVGMASGTTEPGGLGTAGVVVGRWTLSVVVACNAVGSVRAEDGSWLAGGPPRSGIAGEEGAHTTLVAVVTDAPLDREQCTVLAKMASAGLARVLEPAFLPFDGDIVFAAATGSGDRPEPEALAGLGHEAAGCVAAAIRRGVRAADR